MDPKIDRNEWISALADGQLRGPDAARALDAACTDPEAAATWHAYHVIGDVLRSPDLAAAAPSAAFLQKLTARLAEEGAQPVPVSQALPVAPERVSVPAANDASFRWKLVAGVASVAAVAAVGWSVLNTVVMPPAAQPQLAVAPGAVVPVAAAAAASTPQPSIVTRAPSGVMLRDAKLDEFLAAHRQHGGASALQMPAFLRNATFEGPAGR